LSSYHVCGAGFAFLGFSLSLIIGLWVDNTFVTLVLRSLFIMLIFYVLGCVLFWLGQKAIQENFNEETKKSQDQNQGGSEEPDELDETVELPKVNASQEQPSAT